MSAADPRYVMKCPKCGIEWYTTLAVLDRKEMVCRSLDSFTGKITGCGARLPMPVPEERQ